MKLLLSLCIFIAGIECLHRSTNSILTDLSLNCSQFEVSAYTPNCPYGSHRDPSSDKSNCKSIIILTSFQFQRFLNIDDTNENFAILAKFTARWWASCPQFQWDGDDLSLKISEQHWWTPGLFHINAVEDQLMSIQGSRFFFLKRSSDDKSMVQFYWQKVGVFKSNCNLNFDIFPFDEQTCHIRILLKEELEAGHLNVTQSSNTYANSSIETRPLFDIMSKSSSWTWTESLFEENVEEVYGTNRSVATFSLSFKRKSEFYIFNFIVPSFLLNSLSLTAFAIKASDPERLMLAVTLLLSLIVMHSNINEHIPPVPQRNLLSNYADFAILHCWLTLVYFSIMIFAFRRNWMAVKQNHGRIEIVAMLWFSLQIVSINVYLISMVYLSQVSI